MASESTKTAVVLGGLAALGLAIFGGSKKLAPSGVAGTPPRPKLKKGCDCGR